MRTRSRFGHRSYSLSRNLVSLSTRRAIQKSYNVGLISISKSYMINVIQYAQHSWIGTVRRNSISDQRTYQAMTCLRSPKGASHAGRRHAGPGSGLLRGVRELRLRLRTALRRTIMILMRKRSIRNRKHVLPAMPRARRRCLIILAEILPALPRWGLWTRSSAGKRR